MSNLTVENVYIRQNAKELTRKYFWKLLGLMVTAVGITYVVSMVVTSLPALTKSEPIIIIGSFVSMLVNLLVSSSLTLGLYSAMIDLCRGDDTVTVGRVFSRMGECPKAFGLTLWVGLKIILWALPAYALMIVVVLFLINAPAAAAEAPSLMIGESAQGLQAAIGILPLLVIVLIFALVVPAALRYMLSAYILADKPETGVFDCVNQSKAMMKGHKWQAFKLTIPIVLIMFAILLAIIVAMTLLSVMLKLDTTSLAFSAILTIVAFVAMLYFMIRVYLCYTLFYLKRAEAQKPAQAE